MIQNETNKIPKSSRFLHIDFLRALSILGVIVIHVFSYNLTSSKTNINYVIWNYLNFVVVGFVFCSGYVLFAKYNNFENLKITLAWYKKRVLRLLIPYYIYLVIHYAFWIIFPKFFGGLGLKKSFDFFIKSLTLVGGENLNWLVLLFIQLTIIFPLLMVFLKNKKSILSFTAVAIVATTFFTIFGFPYSYYRYVMFIPWSLVLLITFYFVNKERSSVKISRYIFMSIMGSLLFIFFFVIFTNTRSLTLIDNKYPPNLFYLSYGIAITFLVLAISQLKIFQEKILDSFFTFVSRQAYPLFFIHIIVIDFVLKNKIFNNVFLESFFVVIVSLFIAICIQKTRGLIQSLHGR